MYTTSHRTVAHSASPVRRAANYASAAIPLAGSLRGWRIANAAVLMASDRASAITAAVTNATCGEIAD